MNECVSKVFGTYPIQIRKKVMSLRQLILETASEIEGVEEIDETLKWGEPSYIAKTGSTVRIGWKESTPNQYSIYFNCNTKLVDTFKELYGDLFNYVGNREIVFRENEEVPVLELKHCISLALTYHKLKHLPTLGA